MRSLEANEIVQKKTVGAEEQQVKFRQNCVLLGWLGNGCLFVVLKSSKNK